MDIFLKKSEIQKTKPQLKIRDHNNRENQHSEQSRKHCNDQKQKQLQKQNVQINQSRHAFQQDRNKAKTELCKYYQMTKECRFGAQCAFAHGKEELKQKEENKNELKNKPCNKYYMLGHCSYGTRCKYLHTKEMSRLPEYLNFQRNLCYQKNIRNKNVFDNKYNEKLSRMCNNYILKLQVTQNQIVNFNKFLGQALKTQYNVQQYIRPLPFFRELRKQYQEQQICDVDSICKDANMNC